jgi:probable HAF family extracellular repeat protein
MRLHRTSFATATTLLLASLVALHPESASAADSVVLRSNAWAINNRGEIVGDSTTSSGQTRAVYWDSSRRPADLGTLGGENSTAFAINDLGQVVGASDNSSGARRAFMWSAATGMTDLGSLPGATECAAFDVNALGDAVGYCRVPPINMRHGVLWSRGQVVDLGEGETYGINDRGTMVTLCWRSFSYLHVGGTDACNGGTLLESHPISDVIGHFGDINNSDEVVSNRDHRPTGGNIVVLWTRTSGSAYDAQELTGPGSTVWDLNERTEVVGSSSTATGGHAFLWADGAVSDLGTLGGTWSVARGINDRSAVVGSAALPGNESSHAFLWYRGAMTDLGTLEAPMHAAG